MTISNTTSKPLPMYRVSFARITGRDARGQDVLSYPREIGAVWPRKGDKSGGIMQLDIIPVELAAREGVIFLTPPQSAKQTAEQSLKQSLGQSPKTSHEAPDDGDLS